MANTFLPEYQCHKKVRAARILDVRYDSGQGYLATEGPVDNERLTDIPVSEAWLEKHDPQPGGYYVVYEDGYTSYSPAEAFESGYTAIEA